jgi:hypothetical protein
MGQIVHRATALPLATVTAAAAVVLAGCGSSTAHATTTLAGVVDAQVVHRDGSVVPAVDGLRLHHGDVVRTAAAGRAELRTRGRVVYEGSDAAVQVLDGATAELRHGAVVVDAQHGPGLALGVAGLAVATGHGSAVRAERSVTVRIASLAGSTAVTNGAGRHLEVPALTQAVVGGDALPDSTAGSPLRLTDDDGEAHAVPVLVRDDLALAALATGIDGTGTSTARTVLGAWHATLQALPAGVARSEQVLPMILAATRPADAADRYKQAVGLRRAGASWGVVAARLGTSATAALAALQSFEHAVATGQVGSVAAAVAALVGTPVPGGAGAGAGAGRGGGTTSPAGAGGGGGSGSGSGSGSGGGQPSPSPSSSPSSGLVGGTIDRVLSLVPTPLPTPSRTTVVRVPVPLPSAAVPSLPALPALPVGGVVTPAPVPLVTR